jgi:hypothetical protein
MSFIQCKDEAEVEKVLKTRPHGFVSPDHRIYDSIDLGDEAVYHTFDSETAVALLILKQNIEMMGEDGWEACFLQLERDAKVLRESYEKVQALLKAKPIKKSPKPQVTVPTP